MSGTGRTGAGGTIAVLGFLIGIAAALLAAAAGFGSRFGFWGFRVGFDALGWIVYLGAVAAVLSLLGAVLAWRSARNAMVLALIGLVLGVAVVWLPYQSRLALRDSPRLPDVTTDTASPPAFVAALPLRARDNARNPTDYGREKAALQAKHYPDIQPVVLTVPPDEAFARALAAVREMGLEIIAADKPSGRIEATDTTFWFGFRDDVVIRIARAPSGSRVDIRSLSRVGGRDARTNANRVRKLAAKIRTP